MAEPVPPILSLRTQVLRFVITGGIAGAVDFGTYLLLYKAVGLQVDLAKAISFVAGTANFFVLTRYNRSSYYARAVLDLGAAVRAAR